MAELPSIGRHCGWPACQQLDFLPLQCRHCQMTFCKDHLPFGSHSCAIRPDRVLEADECRTVEGYSCNWQDCKRRELVPVLCSQCNLQVCLDHRLAAQHSCPSLKEQEEAAQKCIQREEAYTKEVKLAKQQVEEQLAKQLKNAKNRARAAKVQLMKLKSKASLAKRGLNIPQLERVHLMVKPPGGGEGEVMVVSKVWSLGRVVDHAAELCSQKNTNNLPNTPKLRLVQDDESLVDENKLDAKIESLVQRGELCDGQTLLLRYFE